MHREEEVKKLFELHTFLLILFEKEQMGSGVKTPYFFGNLILLENKKERRKWQNELQQCFMAIDAWYSLFPHL